jgi:pyruvate carboxylase subunit B
MAYIATLDDKTHKIEVQELEEDHLYRISIDGVERIVDGRKLSGHIYSLLFDNRSFTLDVANKDDMYTVACEGKSFRLQLLDERRALRPGEGSSEGRDGGKHVRSFMPGKVVEVLVAVGDEVAKDQGLLIIEAMKMENEVRSTAAGKVREIRVAPGQAVESGELLIELE